MTARRADISLGHVFGPIVEHDLKRWETLNEAEIRVDRQLIGRSDARIALCYVRLPGSGMEKMAVKAVRSKSDWDGEAARHRAARHANPAFASEHLAELKMQTLPISDGSYVMFQELVGGSLVECEPMSTLLGRPALAPAARLLLTSLLEQWNPSPQIVDEDPAALLRQHLGERIGPDGSVFAWAEPVEALLRRPQPWLRFPDGSVRPNPFAFALSRGLFRMPGLQVIAGNSHGDLHLDNAIVRLGPTINRYWLVDLASYQPAAPLCWDHAALLMSILARSYEKMRPGQREVIATYLTDPNSSAINQVRAPIQGALRIIRKTGSEWAEKRGLLDEWVDPYRLALVSSALTYTGRTSISDEARWWFFELASRVLDQFLHDRGAHHPDPESVEAVGNPRQRDEAAINGGTPPRREPTLLGAAPPFLPTPRRNAWSSKTQFRKTTGRFLGQTDDELARVAHPYVYVAFGGLSRPVRTQWEELIPGLMIIEADEEPRPRRIAVQVKHLAPRGHALTAADGRQQAAVIDQFMTTGIEVDSYLFIHDRDHQSSDFNGPVLDALRRLTSTGTCPWAGVWGTKDVAQYLWDAVAAHTIDVALRLSDDALARVGELTAFPVVEAVPTSTYEVSMSAGGLRRSTEESSQLADPAVMLVNHTHGLELVLGQFGYGKSTAAIRAARSSSRRTLLLPGARLPQNYTSSQLMLSTLVEPGIDWSAIPEEVANLVRPMIGPCVEWHLGQASDDLCLIVDGLDEAPLAYRRSGLKDFFLGTSSVRIPMVVSVRTEFWRSKQAELQAAMPLATDASPIRRAKVIELQPWDEDQMSLMIESTKVETQLQQSRLIELRDLLVSGGYQDHYGDVPRRPLFLRMLIDDVLAKGIRPRDRLDLLEGWVERKVLRDWQHPQHVGDVDRPPISGDMAEDLQSTLELAFRLMSLAARLMTMLTLEGQLVLLPTTTLDRLGRQASELKSEIRPAPLFVQSVLVPVDNDRPGRPTEVMFAHRAFQEYFLARSLWLDPDPGVEELLDSDVREWIDRMRGSGPS
ncbi:NACHT domain-containing protein [Micromonospora parva]|uniref:NACHT domain-containing protein n=1 Tax=Micromonospora parva TaxID=1464048 RepID=UPI0033C2F078